MGSTPFHLSQSAAERFYASINMFGPNGCWEWLGRIDPTNGYARFNDKSLTDNGKFWAHRYSYAMHKGPIPEGLVIDHTCNTRSCVNPFHLEAVTQAENLLRSYRRDGRKPRGKAKGGVPV